ncbi:MAG: hypothetical protein V4717_11245 [Bacteroidota bacterium]
MALDPRFTLMAFPQHIKGNQLTVNIVFLPRNFSPLENVPVGFPTTDALTPFGEAKPKFVIKLVTDPNEFAGKVPANEIAKTATVVYSPNALSIYKKLKEAKDEDGNPKYFDIDEARSSGSDNLAPIPSQREDYIKKYLPESYRNSFNFTSPRTPNAVTDDSYQCAVKDNKRDPFFKPTDGKVSWGKVYAHLLRHPLMAVAGGLIYQNITVTVDPVQFKKGGWIYADLDETGDYSQAIKDCPATDIFIKKYAAKIPSMSADPDLPLFAAVLFPVMKPGESPAGVFDDLFIEAGGYNDGFATIVHANQPISANLLKEAHDGIHPQREAGIRLGWDDEQILIWYMRQLMADKNVPGPVAGQFERLDMALGVTGYHIDVKDETDPAGKWESLNAVRSKTDMALEAIPLGSFEGELPYQVYPVKLQGANADNYWLPMYYLNWNEHSVVLPDKAGAEIYRHKENQQKNSDGKTLANSPTDIYTAPGLATRLLYGHRYSFKVRLCDISGGSPSSTRMPKPKGPAVVTSIDFKRYVAPNKLQVIDDDITTGTDDANFDASNLTIRRPLLGYPAVVYTGKYDDPVGDLINAIPLLSGKDEIGLPDPDVTKVEIVVEVESLQMDNLPSKNGKENYTRIYTAYRLFDDVNFSAAINVPIEYKDFNVLNLHDYDSTTLPFDEAEDNKTISAISGKIIIPTSRNVRLTLRAVAEGPDAYFGHLHPDPNKDCRFGKITQLKLRRQSKVETSLFLNTGSPTFIQAIYLQPDPVVADKKIISPQNIQPSAEGMPHIVERLARQLRMEAKNQTSIISPNGERVQFACSSKIRHTLAPDNSSITFAGTNELLHHWLVCSTLDINRDWSWDGIEQVSFAVQKLSFFEKDAPEDDASLDWINAENLPDIELKRAVSYNNQMPGDDGLVHREFTRIVYIDAVDTKPAKDQMPDELRVFYRFRPRFRNADQLTDAEPVLITKRLELPTTIHPFGIPKLVGAGIALSPYHRNKKYSQTEARRRFLWLEFELKPENPDDALFARVLAYAPDQLLSNNHPSLFELSKEPPLPVDPEYIRVITTESSREHNGLNAMQRMKKSVTDDRHFYLLPIPAGMHSESAELFGFFTYEFRFGHTDKVWSTAQGRFGRALRVTGLQHPAPTLTCTVDRDDQRVKVSAPYAQAVANGKNVTSNPPRTSIWCLLYAQVKQADGLDHRNILLDQRKLEQKPLRPLKKIISDKEIMFSTVDINQMQFQQSTSMYKALYKEATRYGESEWSNDDISEMLYLYGLSGDAPLSVLCVEVFGTITNIAEHISDFNSVHRDIIQDMSNQYGKLGAIEANRMKKDYKVAKNREDNSQPLSDELGFHRILRTSPLAEVPFVCCADC